MRILAFDLGTKTGWAFLADRSPVIHGRLDLSPGRFSGGGMRFVRFQAELDRLIHDLYPTLVVFEEVRGHVGVDAAHIYGGLLAILTAKCERAGLPYEGFPVATIKKHATGKGNSKKDQMVLAALRQLNKVPDPELTEDEADAVCLVFCARDALSTPA